MYDAAVALGVPFDRSWNKKQMVLAAIIFIELLFTANEELNDLASTEKDSTSSEVASSNTSLFWRVLNTNPITASFLWTTATREPKPSPSDRGKGLIRRLVLSRYMHQHKVGESTRFELCPLPSDLTGSEARILLLSFR